MSNNTNSNQPIIISYILYHIITVDIEITPRLKLTTRSHLGQVIADTKKYNENIAIH